jgi:hypothetical protein
LNSITFANTAPASVPTGGSTALLLGLSLISFGTVRRKLKQIAE